MPSTPILAKKLQAYGITMTAHLTVSDGLEQVAAAIAEMRKKAGRHDPLHRRHERRSRRQYPGVIARSGARIVTYGAPVLPGAMFLLGYYEDGQPVMGLPGCVMYAKATIFDLILPRASPQGCRSRSRRSPRSAAAGCASAARECHYPVCPFGKE